MNETERILRIILKVSRGPITVRELIEVYIRIAGTSIPCEDHGYWILTDYLTSIPHILSLEGRYNELDAIVTSNEPEEDNTSGTYSCSNEPEEDNTSGTYSCSNEPEEHNTSEICSFSSYETIPDLIGETESDEEVDNQDDHSGFITIKSKREGKGKTVEESDTREEEQGENYSSDPYFIDVKLYNTLIPQDYYWDDSSIVEKENCPLPSDIVHLDHKIQRDSINFNEIEQWLVPSVEEIEEFCDTDLTAEFFLLHCFWRPGDLDDHIQEKMKRVMRRQHKSVKFIQSSELLTMDSMQEIMKCSYGGLYQYYNELNTQLFQDHEFFDTPDESDNESTYSE
ncbi:hypothetical protein WA026_023179 [Henosepilachna vigintioctopunctata]|uniref:Uncharacterized protein n=1 Tax=Henosepilachna vigintioctopunctata TaxID=420089 RepID=A0AAW1UQU3_9CUCU